MKILLPLLFLCAGALAQHHIPVPDYSLLPPKGNQVTPTRMAEIQRTCSKLHREFRRNNRYMPWICQHNDWNLPTAWHNYHYLRGLNDRRDLHSCSALCGTQRVLVYAYYSYPTRDTKVVDSAIFCRCVGIADNQ